MTDYIYSWLEEAMAAVSPVLAKAGVEFFIVGAVARDLWLHQHDASLGRTTLDVDLALYVQSIQQFESVKRALADLPDHSVVSTNPLRIVVGNRYAIDLLPFSDFDEYASGSTIATLAGVSVDLVSFSESWKHGTETRELGGQTYRALSMPAFVLAKLTALLAKPESRLSKDLGDIIAVMDAYAKLETEYVLEHSDDIWDGEAIYEEVAGINFGRRVGRLAVRNPYLRNQVDKALVIVATVSPGSLRNALSTKVPLEHGRGLISQLIRGIRLADTAQTP